MIHPSFRAHAVREKHNSNGLPIHFDSVYQQSIAAAIRGAKLELARRRRNEQWQG
jgi:hypothetical protein